MKNKRRAEEREKKLPIRPRHLWMCVNAIHSTALNSKRQQQQYQKRTDEI